MAQNSTRLLFEESRIQWYAQAPFLMYLSHTLAHLSEALVAYSLTLGQCDTLRNVCWNIPKTGLWSCWQLAKLQCKRRRNKRLKSLFDNLKPQNCQLLFPCRQFFSTSISLMLLPDSFFLQPLTTLSFFSISASSFYEYKYMYLKVYVIQKEKKIHWW